MDEDKNEEERSSNEVLPVETPSFPERQKSREDIFDELSAETNDNRPSSSHSSEADDTPPITDRFENETPSLMSDRVTPVPKQEVKLENVSVRIPDATKDNNVVTFKLYIQKNGEDKLNFARRYEDFLFLQHCLKSEATDLGIIFPPLPPGPIVDLKDILKHNKEQYGSECSSIPAEEFQCDCRRLEKYINSVLQHPLLVNLNCLEEFLLKTEPPVTVNVSAGIMSKMSSSISDYIRSPPKDIDEYFQIERDRLLQQSAAIKSASTNFYKYACSLFRLSTSEDFLATSLIQGNIYGEDNPISHLEMKLMSRISDVYKDETHCDEVVGNNCLKTLSRTLDYLNSYYENVKETLNRRNTLMIEFENATKALNNAKPQKVEQLTQIRKEKEDAYVHCTKLLKIELEAFSKRRVCDLSQSLLKFAKCQITAAVDRQSVLTTHLNTIKALSFD